MYDLPGWMEELFSALKTEEVSGEKVAEMIIVSSRCPAARELRVVARDKIRQRREIIEDIEFRDRLSGENLSVLFEFLAEILFANK